MIGCSYVFKSFIVVVEKIAACDAPVLIEGETGTGKELTARSIHYSGARKDMPFIPINCGALQDSLIESELFGHLKGAFTDAKDHRRGLVEHAEGGTLFLDEVEALTPKAQVTLLRFLQDQHYRPIGGKTLLSANVRIIAASNARLMELAQRGLFRMDLLFRLRMLYLEVPPLRERKEDIPLLVRHFVEVASARFGRPPKPLAPSAMSWLLHHAWPGNVRELENVIYSSVLLSDGDMLTLDSSESVLERLAKPRSFHTAKAEAIFAFERDYLKDLMGKTRGNVSHAAQLAGKERRAMGRLLKKHGIDKEIFRGMTAAS